MIIALVLAGILLGTTLRHFGLRTLHRKSTTRLRKDSVLLSAASRLCLKSQDPSSVLHWAEPCLPLL
jgi:hypothetical protein